MDEEHGAGQDNSNHKEEPSLAMEDLVPRGKGKKTVWTRGLDMLSYSLNSFKLSNLKFVDAKNPRFSQVVRLQLNQNQTKGLLAVSLNSFLSLHFICWFKVFFHLLKKYLIN